MKNRAWVLTLAMSLAACGVGSGTQSHGHVVALVQVENAPGSDPHSGLQKADVVYEYLAEGGITRFTVVYYDPTRVGRIGPVRSIRPVALTLRDAYQGMLFFSGGSQELMDRVHSQRVPAVSEQDQGDRHFQRDGSRPAPHNLFTTGDDISAATAGIQGTSLYSPLAPGSLPADGGPATSLTFQQTATHQVAYTYSEADHAYSYTSERGALTDATNMGRGVEVTNVVLLEAPHRDYGYTDVLGAPVVDFDLTSGGQAVVVSGGRLYPAHWQPPSPGSPPALKTTDGRGFPLPAGLTWFHIVDPGMPYAAR
jgi:hypothetical protein